MIDDMGIVRTTIEISSTMNPENRTSIPDVMVDTGSEYNWMPESLLAEIGIMPVRMERFETADGRILDRPIGFAFIFAHGWSAPAIVVFAQAGDTTRLGANGLRGMNLKVDFARRELIPAGPVPVAAAA